MKRLVLWVVGAAGVAGGTALLLSMLNAGAASFRVEGTQLHVEGQLTLLSTERIDTLTGQHPELRELVLGEIAETSDATALMQKGALVRSLGLNTLVAVDVTLRGDAVYLFLGGVERRLEDGAGLAVGDWQSTLGPASALPMDHAAHQERRGHVLAMLGTPEFYDFAIGAAPVGETRRLTPDELAAYGVLAGD